jgi:hypothetical protein
MARGERVSAEQARLPRRALWFVLTLLIVGALAFLGLTALGVGPAASTRADVVERVTNERPEAKVSAYLRATAAGDEATAASLWEVPDWLARQEVGPRMAERRTAVTRELASLRLEWKGQPAEIQWWRTCCEPGVIESPRDAGFARVHVSLTRPDDQRVWSYTLDVVTRDGAYWGGAMGYQPRQWMLVDVYPTSEQPLYWRWTP